MSGAQVDPSGSTEHKDPSLLGSVPGYTASPGARGSLGTDQSQESLRTPGMPSWPPRARPMAIRLPFSGTEKKALLGYI